MKKFSITLLLSLLMFFVFSAQAAPFGNDKYLWVGGDSGTGGDAGFATVGMIRLSGSDYQVDIGDEDASGQRAITGSAWMGIGAENDTTGNFTNQNDQPSIGYLRFGQNPGGNCFGTTTGDCYDARWNKKTGGAPYEGYLSGWAKISLGLPLESYPEVWVHFKPPVDTGNYGCNETTPARGSNYYACTDSEGNFHGYAWSAGAEATEVGNNPGLGWISLAKAGQITGGGYTPTCPTDVTCNIINNSPNPIYGLPANVNYSSSISSLEFTPAEYQWDCEGDGTFDPPSSLPTKTCTYEAANVYTPDLVIRDNDNCEINCVSGTPVQVFEQIICECQIEAKVSNSEGVPSDDMAVFTNQEINASISGEVSASMGGSVEWSKPSGGGFTTPPAENSDEAYFSFDRAGSASMSATIKNVAGCGDVICDPVEIEVMEQEKWKL